MEQLKTLGEGVEFEYEWTPDNRIKISYGKSSSIHFDGRLYDELIQQFRGRTIRIHNHPDDDNLHDWIYRKGVKTRIAQYIAPVLCWEKHAKKVLNQGELPFYDF
jgi:hypothetical protein